MDKEEEFVIPGSRPLDPILKILLSYYADKVLL